MGEEEDSRRHLMEDHHDHHHDHDHHHHDHSHHHGGEEDHSYHLHSENTMEALADVQRSLRGSSMRLGKRRRLQAGGMYNYQVDIYVEIDQQLCIDTGDDCANNGGQPGAIVINYGKSLLCVCRSKFCFGLFMPFLLICVLTTYHTFLFPVFSERSLRWCQHHLRTRGRYSLTRYAYCLHHDLRWGWKFWECLEYHAYELWQGILSAMVVYKSLGR